jgi:VWFA-related protein
MGLRVPFSRLLAVSACAVIVCPAQTSGQQATQTTAEMTQRDTPLTFSTSVNLVLVPVVVRDAQGHAVGMLKKEDFQLFDRGKAQEILKFSVEKADAPPILADTTIETDEQGNAKPKAAAAGQQVANHFIMWLFDDMHLSFGDLAQTREAAKKVLRDSFEPGTRASIYTTSGHTYLDFTDDRDKLSATLDEIKPWPTTTTDNAVKSCPDAPYAMADAALNRNDQQALLAIQTDFLSCPEAQGMVAAAGFGAKGGATSADVSSYLQSGTGALLRMELVKTVEIDYQDTRNTLLALKGLVRRMSAMPGSRTIALVSPGFYLTGDHRTDEMDVINAAIRNNVTISTLDARGVWTVISGGNADTTPGAIDPVTQSTRLQYEQAASRANQDILEELARDTGGAFFHDNNDFFGGLRQIAAQPEYIYVLGFAPQNMKFDGSYHQLKLVLKNSGGLQMQARRGYFERNHLENPAEEAKEELKEAFFSRDEMRELPVELNTQFFKTGTYKARLSILARIDAKHLKFRKADDRNDDTLTVVGGVFDRDGKFIVGTQKTVDLKLRDKTLDGLPAGGITVKTNLDVSSGNYIVRLVVRDSEGQVMSALNSAVVIP